MLVRRSRGSLGRAPVHLCPERVHLLKRVQPDAACLRAVLRLQGDSSAPGRRDWFGARQGLLRDLVQLARLLQLPDLGRVGLDLLLIKAYETQNVILMILSTLVDL